MEATGANLEPIFLLYDGNGPATATVQLTEQARRSEPLVTIHTEDGIWHRLWGVTDPAELAAIAGDLASYQALIADGHHRYAAYLQLQARKRTAGAGPGPWDAGLALLVDSTAFPPRIGAIHRVVPGLCPATAARLAEPAFTVRALPGVTRQEALAALHEASERHTAFLVAGRQEFYLLTDPDPDAVKDAMPDRSDRWRALSAAVMQELLLGRLWHVRDDDQHVEIHHDSGEALDSVAQFADRTAVICPPLAADVVRDVAAHGERGAAQIHLVRAEAAYRPGTALVRSGLNAPSGRTLPGGLSGDGVRRPYVQPVRALGQRHEVALEVGRQLRGPRDPAVLLGGEPRVRGVPELRHPGRLHGRRAPGAGFPVPAVGQRIVGAHAVDHERAARHAGHETVDGDRVGGLVGKRHRRPPE